MGWAKQHSHIDECILRDTHRVPLCSIQKYISVFFFFRFFFFFMFLFCWSCRKKKKIIIICFCCYILFDAATAAATACSIDIYRIFFSFLFHISFRFFYFSFQFICRCCAVSRNTLRFFFFLLFSKSYGIVSYLISVHFFFRFISFLFRTKKKNTKSAMW